MGGMGGRPKGNAEAGTKQTRIMEDMQEKLSWIIRVCGGSSAQFLDPLIRAAIEAKYAQIEPRVKKLQAMEEALKKAEAEARAASLGDDPAPQSGTPKKRRRPE